MSHRYTIEIIADAPPRLCLGDVIAGGQIVGINCANDEPDIVRWARDGGVTDYIVKPVTAELLLTRVLAAISNPVHIVETATYRGPSPRRRLVPHQAAATPPVKL